LLRTDCHFGVQVGRKGISIERTFTAVSDRAQLEAKVCMLETGIEQLSLSVTCAVAGIRKCDHVIGLAHACTPRWCNSRLLVEQGRRQYRCTSASDQTAAAPGRQCGELAEALAEDMARERLRGKTLTLKLKTSAFEVRTRAVTLGGYVSAAGDIRAEALRLLRAELPLELRLMGIRMSTFYQARARAGRAAQCINCAVRPAAATGSRITRQCSVQEPACPLLQLGTQAAPGCEHRCGAGSQGADALQRNASTQRVGP